MSAPRGRCCTQVPTLRFGGRLVGRVKAILPGKRYWLCLAETKWGLMPHYHSSSSTLLRLGAGFNGILHPLDDGAGMFGIDIP